MRIQSISSSNYNTQFRGVLTLYDNTYINSERIKQTIPKSEDKKLHDVISKIIKEEERSYSLCGGMEHANKKDFAEYIGLINEVLQLDPAKIKMDDSRWAVPFYFLYSNDRNNESYYSINLNNRYSITHEFNRSDIK